MGDEHGGTDTLAQHSCCDAVLGEKGGRNWNCATERVRSDHNPKCSALRKHAASGISEQMYNDKGSDRCADCEIQEISYRTRSRDANMRSMREVQRKKHGSATLVNRQAEGLNDQNLTRY